MVQIETLPNGVRLVTEAMDTVRSAALGIWVGGGSREETPEESGAAHFIEHMLFKGTQRRTAQDIARETDAIGGQMNAFTTKECTCFYGRVLDDHLPQALDILFDMVYCSSFAQEAVETERGVILEEIDMYEDTPDDLCAEKLFGAVFAGSPLARPILGREETLAPMTGAFLKAYHDAHYRGDNTVVALTGSFSQEVLEDIRRRFSALPAGKAPAPVPAAYTPAFVATPKPIGWTTTPPSALPCSSCLRSWAAACPPGCFSRCGNSRGFATPSTPTARATRRRGSSVSTRP